MEIETEIKRGLQVRVNGIVKCADGVGISWTIEDLKVFLRKKDGSYLEITDSVPERILDFLGEELIEANHYEMFG